MLRPEDERSRFAARAGKIDPQKSRCPGASDAVWCFTMALLFLPTPVKANDTTGLLCGGRSEKRASAQEIIAPVDRHTHPTIAAVPQAAVRCARSARAARVGRQRVAGGEASPLVNARIDPEWRDAARCHSKPRDARRSLAPGDRYLSCVLFIGIVTPAGFSGTLLVADWALCSIRQVRTLVQ
jgi:hypothetical protein